MLDYILKIICIVEQCSFIYIYIKNQYTIQTLINIMYARDLVLSQALLEKDKGRTDVGQKEYGRNCWNKHDILIVM